VGSSSSEKPLVVTLLQLGVDLLDRLEADPDDDQDAGATEREVLVAPTTTKAISGMSATDPGRWLRAASPE
jgi:hypothetical protein